MDLLTLTICTVMFSAMTAAALVSLYVTKRTDKALRDWARAGVLFFVCNLAILASATYSMPWLLSPVLTNVLYIAAHGFILSGITRHTRNVSATRTVVLFSSLVLAIQFVPAVSENVSFRLLAIVPVMLTLNVLSLFHLWRFRNTCMGKGYWTAIGVLTLFIAFTVVNMIVIMVFPSQLEFLGSDIVQTTNLLATTLYIAGITLGIVFIHAWQRELTLQTISRTDALSGWFNRHALNEFANREFARCQRDQTTFAFISFDIDHFKNVNDTYGHTVGDDAIRHIAHVAKEATREYDYHFRLGGEEFAIMVSGLKVGEIRIVAERVRNAIQQTPFKTKGENIQLSASVGLATSEEGDLSWHVVLERADNALYRAKKSGRNTTRYISTNNLTLVKH